MPSGFLGLRLTGDVDPTSLATVVLAVVTYLLARYSRDAVRQGQSELEASQRPVVVPVADPSQLFRPVDIEAQALVPVLSNTTLYVPIKNVGVGPALNLRCSVRFRDAAGMPTAAGLVEAAAELSAIGAGEVTALVLRDVKLTDVTGFIISLVYEDVSFARWQTVALYIAQAGTYRGVNVTAGPPTPMSELDMIFRPTPRGGWPIRFGP